LIFSFITDGYAIFQLRPYNSINNITEKQQQHAREVERSEPKISNFPPNPPNKDIFAHLSATLQGFTPMQKYLCRLNPLQIKK
jgi:hypothetical protein